MTWRDDLIKSLGEAVDRKKRLEDAAPEMLEALKAAADSMFFAETELTVRGLIPVDDSDMLKDRIKWINAIIAKAEGWEE